MKHKFLLAGLMFLVSLSLSAETYSGTCGDNLTWTLDTESGILTISGTGAMTNYTSSDNVPWYSYLSSIKTVIIEDGVTSIGNYAFYYCKSLTSVTIPNSVTSIGQNAFRGCSGLTSVTIPNSVTSIRNYAFHNCSGLTSVTIPNSVTGIGDYAFAHCSSLTSITIPNSVTSIGDYAFYDCRSLTSVTIPNGVTSIGEGAFEYCSSLTSITIPNSVTSIGSEAFSHCCNLTSPVFNAHVFAKMPQSYSGAYTIPDGIESIAGYAFEDCSSLTSITIPNSVTSIENNAFNNCKINKIYFSGTMEEWCTKSFSPGTISSSYTLYINDVAVTNAVIPNSVKSIGNYTFYNCSSLTSITIPNSVTSIGNYAFSGCSSLPIIDGIRYADTYLVEAVNRTLSTYTIKEGTRWIGNGAFSDCNYIKSIIMESATPPSFSTSSFPNKIVVYVPLGALKAYQDDKNWKNYDLRLFDTTIKTSAVSPTSAAITFSASLNGEDKNKYIAACGIEEGEEFSGNTAEYIGLEPESQYANVPFYIRTTKGDILTMPLTFKTSALTLTTLASKAVSNTTSILLAETNMSDSETSCGFEWRRNDQPADMPSNQVLCPVANGLMAGRLKGLKDDVYYKYRAFYKSAAGNYYYGDWQYIFTGDVTVEFDPVLYTYAAQFVSERKATLKGYALAGSDDFTEQGFEYWAESRRTDAPARRAPQYAIGEKHTVTGTGISMRVTLSDLDEGTVYKYRTYAKVGGKTLYGTEMTFITQGTYEEPIETDLEQVGYDNAGEDDRTPATEAPQVRKYIRNGILLIERNGKTYTAQGQRID